MSGEISEDFKQNYLFFLQLQNKHQKRMNTLAWMELVSFMILFERKRGKNKGKNANQSTQKGFHSVNMYKGVEKNAN